MARRDQIMSAMGASGGTTAPPRRKQIREALGPGLKRPPGIGGGAVMPPPKRFPSFPQDRSRPVSGATINQPVNPGAQLKGRVQSGAISGERAQKVARQRQMLRKAFGSDWRTKVYGQGGAKGISGPFAQRQVAAKRQQGLERAKRKLY